jgi:hypothetical protein
LGTKAGGIDAGGGNPLLPPLHPAQSRPSDTHPANASSLKRDSSPAPPPLTTIRSRLLISIAYRIGKRRSTGARELISNDARRLISLHFAKLRLSPSHGVGGFHPALGHDPEPS